MSQFNAPSDINAFAVAILEMQADPSFGNFKRLITAFDKTVKVERYHSNTNIEHDGRVVYCIPDDRTTNRKCYNYIVIDGGNDVLIRFGNRHSAYIMNVSKKFQCQKSYTFDYNNGVDIEPARRISLLFQYLTKIFKSWKNEDSQDAFSRLNNLM